LFDAKVARLSRGLAACAVLCTFVLSAARAQAEDLHPTLLAYKAPADCPPVGDFQRSVQRRSSRIHFVDEGSHERELWVFLHKEGDFTVGELRLIEQNGSLRQRSVRFTTCGEAVEGLALIATVSLDPEALLSGAHPVPETSAAEPAKTPPPAARAPRRRPPAPRPPPPPEPPEESSAVEVKVGLEPSVLFRAVPKASAFGGTAFLDVGSSSRHLFAPVFSGAITHVERLGIAGDSGDAISRANFALTLVTLSGCPLRIGGNVVAFRPCARAAGGALRAWGTDTNQPQAATRNYWSWGGAGVLSAQLSELVEIVGDAGVGVNLIRDTFTFGRCTNPKDCTQVGKTPPLYISTGLGLRLLLP
jgi:hypothetical protein